MHSRFPLCPLLALCACAAPGVSPSWEAETILSAGTKLGGCAVGDLDPSHPGAEVAAVAGDGDVYLAWRQEGEWAHAVLATYWCERLGCDSLTAYQASARGGRLSCRLDDESVWIGGALREAGG